MQATSCLGKPHFLVAIKQEKTDEINQEEEQLARAMSLANSGDYPEAIMRFTLLSDQFNHPAAQNELGKIYHFGLGDVIPDEKKAIDYFARAAVQEHAPAQYNLGVMYLNGWGTAKNDTLAFAYFKSSAEQGHSLAQYNTAAMYSKGWGVKKDDLATAIWLDKSGYAAEEAQLKIQQMNQYYRKFPLGPPIADPKQIKTHPKREEISISTEHYLDSFLI